MRSGDVIAGRYRLEDVAGRHAQAREMWQRALELFQTQHRTADADRVRELLER